LGFFHRWLQEFAKHCEKLTVICLEKGKYDLPENVKVLSLGKEQNKSRIKYLQNFYRYIRNERDNYDAVFVHMNPIYVVLGGLFWRAWKKKIALWYTHKSVDLKLRLAEKLSNIIFTASEESFRLKSDKVVVTGHGIDTEKFYPSKQKSDEFRIINIGRISKVKNQLKLVKIFSKIQKPAVLELVGVPAKDKDQKYLQEIKDFVSDSGISNKVNFVGSLSQDELVNYYNKANLIVNLSETGSMDKDVLEACACNIDVLTSNEAYKGILPSENIVEFDDEQIKERLIKKIEHPEQVDLRSVVEKNHSLPKLIEKIIEKL